MKTYFFALIIIINISYAQAQNDQRKNIDKKTSIISNDSILVGLPESRQDSLIKTSIETKYSYDNIIFKGKNNFLDTVGIGTSTPTAMLEVNGDYKSNAVFTSNGLINGETRILKINDQSDIIVKPHALITVKNQIFVGELTPNPRVIKFSNYTDLTDFKGPDDSVQMLGYNAIYKMVYDEMHDKIYGILGNSEEKLIIFSLNPTTMAWSVVYSSKTINGSGNGSICTDFNYLYGVTNEPVSSFFKIRISDWTLSTYKTWENTGVGGHAIDYNPLLNEVYATSSGNSIKPAYLAKVNPLDLSYTEVELGLGTSTDDFYIKNDTNNIDKTTIYIGFEYTDESYVVYPSTMEASSFKCLWSYGFHSDGKDLICVSKEGYVLRYLDFNTESYILYRTPNDIPNEFCMVDDLMFYTDWTDGEIKQFEWGTSSISDIRGSVVFSSGIGNSVMGDFSGTIGKDNTVIGNASFATGLKNTVYGNYSSAFGEGNMIGSKANWSMAFGKNLSITTGFTFVWGLASMEWFKISSKGIFAGKNFNAGGNSIKGGNITGINLTSTENTTIEGNIYIPTPEIPSSSTSFGETGQIAWDSNYIYICVDKNTWKRVAISTW